MKLHPYFKTRISKSFSSLHTKIKVPLTSSNLDITNGIAYNEITVRNFETSTIRSKKFIFDSREQLSVIKARITEEYGNQVEFNGEIDAFLTEQLQLNKTARSKAPTIAEELNEIAAALKISREDATRLVDKCFEKPVEVKQHRIKLQHQFFKLCSELEKLEKLRQRVESKTEFHITLRLTIMVAILIAQTSLFFYWIFYVEDLGWDLVEPLTFLVSSCLFLGSIFLFVKLNKNYYSFETIRNHWWDRLFLKNSMKLNYNAGRYDFLQREKKALDHILKL